MQCILTTECAEYGQTANVTTIIPLQRSGKNVIWH
jgi:hypothetical protein